MTGIFFRPDKTQIVSAEVKHKKLKILKTENLGSFFDILQTPNKKNAGGGEEPFRFAGSPEKKPLEPKQANRETRRTKIETFFRYLRENSGIKKYDEVYIVLPDEIFSVVDVIDYTTDENLQKTIEEMTGKDFEKFYVTTPIKATPGQYNKRTVYAIDKKLIDDFAAAAEKCNILLTSIEPASLSMVRAVADWRTEKIFFPIYRETAEIISYSPLGGVFRLETNMTGEVLQNYGQAADQDVKTVLRQRDAAADWTYQSSNVNVPVTVLGSYKRLKDLPALRDRADLNLKMSEIVEGVFDDSKDWIGTVGTLLQDFDEDSELYSSCPQFLKIESGNILPENIRVGTKIKMWGQVTQSILKKATAVLSVILAAGAGAIFYLNSIEVTSDLQSRYNTAKKEELQMNQDIQIITLAKKENVQPIESFFTLLKYRPEELKLTNVNVGNMSGNNATEFIKFVGVSENPILFQEMLSKLRGEKLFANCSLNEITSDTKGIKKANFILGKAVGNK